MTSPDNSKTSRNKNGMGKPMPFFYCRGTLAVALLRATTGSICLRFGLVDGDGTATDFCAMQTLSLIHI